MQEARQAHAILPAIVHPPRPRLRARVITLFAITIFATLSTVAASAQTPGPPRNVSATIHEDGIVTFIWEPPGTGAAPTGYVVQITGPIDMQRTVQARAFTTEPLPAGRYTVAIYAANGAGVSSPAQLGIDIPCGSPVTATDLSWRPLPGNRVQVLWTKPPEAHAQTTFSVHFGSAPGLSDVLVTTPQAQEALTSITRTLAAGTYYVRIVGQRACGTETSTSSEMTVVANEPTGTSQLLVNEVAPNTFIELKNVGNTPLQIGGWYIMTGLKVTQRIATIPNGTTLPAGCTFLITSTSHADLTVPNTLGWREGVGIVDPTGRIRDSVAIDRDDDDGTEYPLVEGTRVFGIPSGFFDRSVARVADADTNNNAADFIVLTSPTPQSSAACAPAGAPAPPTQLGATVNGGSVMLNWAPASGELTQYILEAGTAPGATNVGTFYLPPHLNGLLVPVVAEGRYYVRLRASTAQAVSNASNEVEVVVCWNSCTVPPGDTTQLALQVSGNSVLLSWTPPSSGGPISTYVVEAGSASGLADLAVFATGSTARFVIVNGVPPGIYFVRVRAFGPGGSGGVSNQIVIVVP